MKLLFHLKFEQQEEHERILSKHNKLIMLTENTSRLTLMEIETKMLEIIQKHNTRLSINVSSNQKTKLISNLLELLETKREL